MGKDHRPDKWLCLLLIKSRTWNRPFLVHNELCNLHGKLSPSALSAWGTKYSCHRPGGAACPNHESGSMGVSRSTKSLTWPISGTQPQVIPLSQAMPAGMTVSWVLLVSFNQCAHWLSEPALATIPTHGSSLFNLIHFRLTSGLDFQTNVQPGSGQSGLVRKCNSPPPHELLNQIPCRYKTIPSPSRYLSNKSYYNVFLSTLELPDHWFLYFLSVPGTFIPFTSQISLDFMVRYSVSSNTLTPLAYRSFCCNLLTIFQPCEFSFLLWACPWEVRRSYRHNGAEWLLRKFIFTKLSGASVLSYDFSTSHGQLISLLSTMAFSPAFISILASPTSVLFLSEGNSLCFREKEEPLNGNALAFPSKARKAIYIWTLLPSGY